MTVSANATDNVGVASVQFTLDGAPLSSPDTVAPYSITWNTTTTTNGTHTLSAQAKDAANNTGTAANVSVTVSNATDTTPPTITLDDAGHQRDRYRSDRQCHRHVLGGDQPVHADDRDLYPGQTDHPWNTARGDRHLRLDDQDCHARSHGQSRPQHDLRRHDQGWCERRRRRAQAMPSPPTRPGAFTTKSAPTDVVTLVGATSIGASLDNNMSGMAEAFLNTATTSGTANKLFVYVDSTSAASQIVVGIYSNAADDTPGSLLAQATITTHTKGAWNSVTIPATTITAGTKYWIAVLGPAGGGTIQFRDGASGGKAQTSAQTNLTTLPAT